MRIFAHAATFIMALLFSLTSAGDDKVVASDGGVSITQSEFEAALALTPESFRASAANDEGDRLELINNMLQIRKMAKRTDLFTPDDPEYWKLKFEILAIKRSYAYEQEKLQVELPDPGALAREYYATQKDKYATKPETRASSHILLASPPGLPREGVREKAQKILDDLRAGADFEDMVSEYSQDPGSKARGGSLDTWIRFGDPKYTPPYSEALFTIAEVGGYSEITDSQFGVHIIRLDGIREGGYYSFDEVKQKIYVDIAAEFRDLAAKNIAAKYNITDDAFIDGAAMEELFAPYKTE